ncbi:MAG TPA: alpha/beta fold hydrolase [Solirubrobacteraceae bacterium]|nr:alpha/beta fold hydrolase [Solirubrobacteraceae bacterium]
MATARIDGNDIYYERRGRGEPMLLIQGMSGTHLAWGDPFLDALAEDFEVIAYDHRGVGRSSRVDEGFTLEQLAEDAARLLDATGIERAHVTGISMGGMVAQDLALGHPDRIRTLVLGCSYAGGEGSALTPPGTFERLAEAWQSGDRERALRTGWEINVSEQFASREGEYEKWREMALTLRVPLAIIRLQLQAIAQHDTSARLGEISAPTLVIHGTDDQMLPAANSRVIADAIPGARLEELDGVGHLFWWEQPERSAALIRDHALAGAAAE